MSYALRNTLILLGTLLLLTGGIWYYLTRFPDKKIEAYERILSQRQRDLRNFSAKADGFDIVQQQYIQTTYRLYNHKKELLKDNNVAVVFDYLREVNRGPAFTVMNFSFRDSVLREDHGVLRFDLDGEGSYRNFFNFISILEQSRPIYRILNMEMRPYQDLERLGQVQYRMQLEAYYARGSTQTASTGEVRRGLPLLAHNPFYPLIHAVAPNTDGLIEVENSRLIAATTNSIYLIDQRQRLQKVDTGDRVYLGFLERINFNEGTASFRLNKGGITDVVVLKIGAVNEGSP